MSRLRENKRVANSGLALVNNTLQPDFLLASTSERRVELLQQLGAQFEQIRVLASEIKQDDETAEEYALRVATDKAIAGWERLGREASLPVLGADTIVIVDDEVFGKPRDQAHALAMLAALSDRDHVVKTAVALVDGERELTAMSTTQVSFAKISEQALAAYWATGESDGKAGAYAIQGQAAQFVRHIKGSYSGVVGLPLYETAQLLRAFNIALLA